MTERKEKGVEDGIVEKEDREDEGRWGLEGEGEWKGVKWERWGKGRDEGHVDDEESEEGEMVGRVKEDEERKSVYRWDENEYRNWLAGEIKKEGKGEREGD